MSDEEKKEFRVPDNSMNSKKNMTYLFLITFVVAIIFVSICLKGISPNMDLDIGDDPVASMDQRGDDENTNIRAQIDQRLRMIRDEDSMPGVSSSNGTETPDEVIERLTGKKKPQKEEKEVDKEKQNEESSFHMEQVRVNTGDAAHVNTISKIYVGQFSDMQSAVAMQDNIMASNLQVTPIIKTVNGYYTIQVGAFTSYESAKNLAVKLNNAGFSAKVVKEVH